MDNTNIELSPYEIDLLCDSLTQFLDFVSSCGEFLRVDDPPQCRFDDINYLRCKLLEVRLANKRTYTGYYSLEVVKKWHSQLD